MFRRTRRSAAVMTLLGALCIASPLLAQGTGPIEGALLEGELDVNILDHAHEGSSILLVGHRLQPNLRKDPIVVAFHERTLTELWRDTQGISFEYKSVAIGQGIVCAAGNPDPITGSTNLVLRCYQESDGLVIFTKNMVAAPGDTRTTLVGSDALTMSGKALVVRTGGGVMGRGFVMVFDPKTGLTM